MEHGAITISKGVADLLTAPDTLPPLDDMFFFEGDLEQMAVAGKVAEDLGITVGISGHMPYVSTKKEFEQVVQYIILHKITGYWHYTK